MTTSVQLFNKLKYFDTFLGVFPCDKLPKLNSLPVSLIMNTDPHNKPGQHWVAININTNRYGLYFDSYGLPPLNSEFVDFLNENCNTWSYNRFIFQGYNSFTCGEFCVLFVLLETLGYSLYDYYNLLTRNFKTNDEIVKTIFKSL